MCPADGDVRCWTGTSEWQDTDMRAAGGGGTNVRSVFLREMRVGGFSEMAIAAPSPDGADRADGVADGGVGNGNAKTAMRFWPARCITTPPQTRLKGQQVHMYSMP